MFLTLEDQQFLTQFDDDSVWLSEALKLECMRMQAAGVIELGVCNESPRKNWVEERGGLPDMVNRIVKHLVEKGMTCSHAIAVAINAVKKGGATGDVNWPGVQHMNSKSQAEYAAAAGHWQSMKNSK